MHAQLTPGSDANHSGEEGTKKPDKQYRSIRIPRGRTKDWPTVVLEVALSETTRKVIRDVKYWLRQSQGFEAE